MEEVEHEVAQCVEDEVVREVLQEEEEDSHQEAEVDQEDFREVEVQVVSHREVEAVLVAEADSRGDGVRLKRERARFLSYWCVDISAFHGFERGFVRLLWVA